MLNLAQALNTALEAAEAAAEALMEGYGQPVKARHKGPSDLVTEYDEKSEKIIKSVLGRAYPSHALYGEEGGRTGSAQAEYIWYIDPIDGTTNFVHGHPFFAVSLGLARQKPDGRRELLLGVINAPALGELYWGSLGGGARRRQSLAGRGLREYPLAVSQTGQLGQAVLNTGFPYDLCERPTDILSSFGRLILSARAVRRAGSAALDLAYVAAGRADAFWETGLKPWDVAAGLLLLSEAGGRASDYQGRELDLETCQRLVVSNGRLHDTILEHLK